MRRRELLVTAGAVVSAGCVEALVGGKWAGEHIKTTALSVRDAGGSSPVNEPPSVAFRPESKQVVVSGALLVGSESCDEAKIESIRFEEGTLHTVVTYGEAGGIIPPLGCTGAMTADEYELVVTFRDFVPETVVAEERDAVSESRMTTTTRTKPVD
ncbi:hypothetical protein [Haladaptatus cibarius]|uniref:hypothetical protein n=1 Tax=Haladaptatus cibarius TaxID=453847 RepID=UPI0006785224|nr:hypothetical protein [Haladaptatus cibarius]